jgi:hypothetical protein
MVRYCVHKSPSLVTLLSQMNIACIITSTIRHLKSKVLSRKTTKTLYITLIRPVLLYGLEMCMLYKADENRLGTSERRILKKIYGPVKEKDTWSARYNQEF